MSFSSSPAADVCTLTVQGEYQRQVLQHVSLEGKRALQEFHEQNPTGPPGLILKVSCCQRLLMPVLRSHNHLLLSVLI